MTILTLMWENLHFLPYAVYSNGFKFALTWGRCYYLISFFILELFLLKKKKTERDGQIRIEVEKLKASNWIILVLQKRKNTTNNNCSKLGVAIATIMNKFHIVDFWILKTYSEWTSLQNTALYSTLALRLSSFPILCSALNSFSSRVCFLTHDKHFTIQGTTQACRTIPIPLYRRIHLPHILMHT